MTDVGNGDKLVTLKPGERLIVTVDTTGTVGQARTVMTAPVRQENTQAQAAPNTGAKSQIYSNTTL